MSHNLELQKVDPLPLDVANNGSDRLGSRIVQIRQRALLIEMSVRELFNAGSQILPTS